MVMGAPVRDWAAVSVAAEGCLAGDCVHAESQVLHRRRVWRAAPETESAKMARKAPAPDSPVTPMRQQLCPAVLSPCSDLSSSALPGPLPAAQTSAPLQQMPARNRCAGRPQTLFRLHTQRGYSQRQICPESPALILDAYSSPHRAHGLRRQPCQWLSAAPEAVVQGSVLSHWQL